MFYYQNILSTVHNMYYKKVKKFWLYYWHLLLFDTGIQ